MSESILERVEAFVCKQNDEIAQADVVAAFPGEPANVVRLTLGALRRQGKLQVSMEGGVAYYSPPAPPETRQHAKPVGAPVTREPEPAAPEPEEESAPDCQKESTAALDGKKAKIMRALRLDGGNRYRMSDIVRLVGLEPEQARTLRRAVASLVTTKRLFMTGTKAAAVYSLTPFPAAPPAMTPRALEVARQAQSRHENEAVELEPRHIEATSGASGTNAEPRFAYWSDGTLELDCENCNGKLGRRDIEALRKFVAVIPALEGE